MRYAVIDLDKLEEMMGESRRCNEVHIERTGEPSAFHQGRWLAYRFTYEEMIVEEL